MAKTLKRISFTMLFFLLFNFVGSNLNLAYSDDVKVLEKVAISLIIDKSGSMNDTDPNLMRETSAEILIDLLSPEDYLGIISFSAEAKELQSISEVGKVGKDDLKGKLAGNLEAEGETDYLEAFNLAYKQMESIEDNNIKKVIIFLTDGDPDPDAERRDEPGFMDGYMESFWVKVKEIGLAGYSVHTVGLGTLNSEVMDRLALESTGTSNVYNEPSDVAVAFFDIINKLKNRSEFMNVSETVDGEKSIDFKMEQFVSQETFVIRNVGGPIDVDFIAPDGVNKSEALNLVKTENYIIATINQNAAESSGDWKMKLTGNAPVEILGAKDLFVKIWFSSPINNSLHPIGEPLEIRATLTGTSGEDITVEGEVLINGVQSLQALSLEKDGDGYIGVLKETQTRGIYEVILNVRSGDEIIANTMASVNVKLLPAIKTDLILSEVGYIQGEDRIITSSLTLASTNLKVSDGLLLDYYELVQRDDNNEEIIVSLNDDGVFENGDVKAQDGVFSGVLTFAELGEREVIIRARGTYNGDLFILEKNLGKTKILLPGIVDVSAQKSSFELIKGNIAEVVLHFKSTSPYKEVIGISIDEKYGALNMDAITLEPMEEKTVTVFLTPKIESESAVVIVPMSFSIGNELTSLSSDSLDLELSVTTNIDRILNRVKDNAVLIFSVLLVLMVIVLLIYATGRIFYATKFKKLYYVNGRLLYSAIDEKSKDLESGEIEFSTFGKSKIVLTFSENRKGEADYYIPGSRYEYDLIFEKQVDEGKYKFIDGYKSLKKKSPPKVLIRTTGPGILVIDGSILIKHEVEHQAVFSSGEYKFSYESGWVGDKQVDTSKNILKGKF